MLSRFLMLSVAVLGFAVPSAHAGRWDVALDGRWMRCLIDVDQVNQTVTARLADVRPNGNVADIENLVFVDAGPNFLLQGTITKGTFTIGTGARKYEVGDRFFLFLSKYTDDVMLILVDHMSVADFWSTPLAYF